MRLVVERMQNIVENSPEVAQRRKQRKRRKSSRAIIRSGSGSGVNASGSFRRGDSENFTTSGNFSEMSSGSAAAANRASTTPRLGLISHVGDQLSAGTEDIYNPVEATYIDPTLVEAEQEMEVDKVADENSYEAESYSLYSERMYEESSDCEDAADYDHETYGVRMTEGNYSVVDASERD